MLGILVSWPLVTHAHQSTEDSAPRAWAVAGYGSLGIVHSNEKTADFAANAINPGRAGRSREYSFDVDSRLAGQLDVALRPGWDAVIQVIAERNLDHDFTPAIEWANVRYRYSPEWSIRVGRVALPIFLLGDYRKASYALPWTRPPVEVYGALPVSNSDGIDISYKWTAAGINNITQLSYGRTQLRIGESAHARARQLIGISDTATTGSLTMRASLMTTVLSVDIATPLFDSFRRFGPAGAQLADTYDVAAKRTTVAAVGFSYDPGAWFLMGETGRMNAHSYLGDKTVAYLSGGTRLGALTPFLTYSSSRSHQPLSDAGLPMSSLPSNLVPVVTVMNQQLNGLLRTIAAQHTVSAGLRWDYTRDQSFKLQYDRVRPEGQSNGTFINVSPNFRSGHPVHVISAMLDFVF